MPARPSLVRCLRLLGGSIALGLVLALPVALAAQMPGAPVLQNAFANRGMTVAGNYASGEDTKLYGLALAYSPGAGRFQFSGGLGRLDAEGAEQATAWGLRFAVPLFSFAQGRGGAGPFVGIGGASWTGTEDAPDARVLQVPAGVGAGWRMALGTTRALSFYATGTYLWVRTTISDETQNDGLVRFAAAADVTLIRNLGLTVGYEGGANADPAENEGGPTGGILGIGLSWAFR